MSRRFDRARSKAMSTNKRFDDVTKMVQECIDSPKLTAELQKQVARRHLIKRLLALRAAAGISQEDMAKKLGCTQSRISKLESSNDADWRFGDVIKYISAVGYRTEIVFFKQDA